MKKTAQAVFLILLAAAAVFVAAHSYNRTTDSCKREWESMYARPDTIGRLVKH